MTDTVEHDYLFEYVATWDVGGKLMLSPVSPDAIAAFSKKTYEPDPRPVKKPKKGKK